MSLAITACASFVQAATEPVTSLRETVREACPNAPRRLNRLIELSLIGAHRAVKGHALPSDTQIAMTFTSGCLADSVTLVRDVAAGQPVMPVNFINMSSNMAGFYVAASLGLHSGNQVIATDDFTWEAALELAMLGNAGRRGLLLGAVEECASPLDEARERLGVAADTPLLEASHWLFASVASETSIGSIEHVRHCVDDAALVEFLASLRLPADARVHVHSTRGSDAAYWSALIDRSLWVPERAPGYTGLLAAQTCVEFLLHERGTLLHLTRGRTGAWYAVLLIADA